MSETIGIIADIIAEASIVSCGCEWHSNAKGESVEENNGKYYIQYVCGDCLDIQRFRWIPRKLNKNESEDEEHEDEDDEDDEDKDKIDDDGICRSYDLLVPPGTEIHYSSNGRPYYYDETLGKTHWAEYEEVIDDEDNAGNSYYLDFDLLRREILTSKGKFATLKALMEYFEMDYESEGYTIPQIYEQLKNKNYVKRSAYILYKLKKDLFREY